MLDLESVDLDTGKHESHTPSNRTAHCRFCQTKLSNVFVDLGLSPLANSYLTEKDLSKNEPFFPLKVFVCDECFLVQLEEWEAPENIFSDYAYFSSYSESWLRHARDYVEAMTARFGIDQTSHVVEIASNDGYLLQYFVEKGTPVLGIEPAQNVAAVARSRGIPTRVEFFGQRTARALRREGLEADLLIGNNVLAHVPDLNDFVSGLRTLLKPQGVLTMEFPHLLRLYDERQIDTIYHEHFSYFSLIAVEKVFAAHGLTVFDVEEVPTHGGSLRIFAQNAKTGQQPISARLGELRDREIKAGLSDIRTYLTFAEQATQIKRRLRDFLVEVNRAGKRVVGYGAPAKGNTLLNFCDVDATLVEYTVDRNPYKQGRFLPGTHIPIYEPERISVTKPDYILILPWNLKDEIIEQLSFTREWGCQFIIPIPDPQVVP
ncbi:C-methyltransferase [Methylobacterium sp. 4-46]|uniref:class I SAM-dependent methyltransferase n=1 Tax=unclassified Methylobacterium TaxID=2615210 RepID=UPI000152D612|nr:MULTISPECIES: class I SAM-dependent methyltransferase [Methylobacterium]ACA19315.1 C-methyltransferase [Methylobacterium sp. 4-46]WFT78517.1 class I SAM-dependent methyltransferase [Methylobacterium nodulans]